MILEILGVIRPKEREERAKRRGEGMKRGSGGRGGGRRGNPKALDTESDLEV